MQKALPSRQNKNKRNEQWVYLIAKGVYPTKPNANIGKYLDPERKDPPKEFAWSNRQSLSARHVLALDGWTGSTVSCTGQVPQERQED
jgi:hypothetical protein